PGTSNMPTIFSASAGRITYGLARVLLPWWAATVHSPSSYARVTVRAGGGLGLPARAFRPARFAGRGDGSADPVVVAAPGSPVAGFPAAGSLVAAAPAVGLVDGAAVGALAPTAGPAAGGADAGTADPLALRVARPRGGRVRSAGANGSSSRPNRTTSHSSDSAGSVSRTTCPTSPAIWPADSVNITFGLRPVSRLARIASMSDVDRPPGAAARLVFMASSVHSFPRSYQEPLTRSSDTPAHAAPPIPSRRPGRIS